MTFPASPNNIKRLRIIPVMAFRFTDLATDLAFTWPLNSPFVDCLLKQAMGRIELRLSLDRFVVELVRIRPNSISVLLSPVLNVVPSIMRFPILPLIGSFAFRVRMVSLFFDPGPTRLASNLPRREGFWAFPFPAFGANLSAFAAACFHAE
jgi:hypothetical protein